jgi:hypothetical protein
MEHILKTVEPYLAAVASGEKTFEIRRNDRAFQKGDTVLLYDPEPCGCKDPFCDSRLARAKTQPIRMTITFVFAGDPGLRDLGGIIPGHVILGLSPQTIHNSSEEDR